MGAVCPGGTMKVTAEFREKKSGFSGKLKSMTSFSNRHKDDSHSSLDVEDAHNLSSGDFPLSISRELKPSTPARTGGNKVPQMSSFLGKAGIVGLEKAVDVLDTLGSSMSNLNVRSGFGSYMAPRGNKISILAFEVANTIAKGANLLQSLSEENVQFLEKEIFHSEGVQRLVSTDVQELISIAAADKREEFDVFSREVVRFGDLCKDPLQHNLDRFFSRVDLDLVTPARREEAETTMQGLTALAQHTSELYHEINALDRFEQDYRRKVEEVESLHLPRRGESLMILQSELKNQRKVVRSMKKKSLWSKNLDEVVEKLVDIVIFIHLEILEAFGDNVVVGKKPVKKPERLGIAGLALHYANIITQIDNVASRPTSLPPNMRDTLYHGLPNSVKGALRTHLRTVDADELLTVPQIKSEMEKNLQWLVPIAMDTTKSHQGFGWVGEWANTGSEFGKKTSGIHHNILRVQTLYHADKKKMDAYILELVTWLHCLISRVSYREKERKAVPVHSPFQKGLRNNSIKVNRASHQLTTDDKNLLEELMKPRRLIGGLSKSQEFSMGKKTKLWGLSRSTGSSPRRDFEYTKSSLLDILDGLHTTF